MATEIRPGRLHVSLGTRPKVTIIIPCFNERATVLDVLARVADIAIDKAILIVDNCSTDGTREALAALCDAECTGLESGDGAGGEPRILNGSGFTVILQPRNLQKGTSVRLGVALADSDYVICHDADLEYDPADIVRLVDYAERTGADAVFGSRFMQGQLQLDVHGLGRSALTAMFRMLYGSRVTDVATCYKLMKSSVAKSLDLRSTGFDLDFEIAAKLRRAGYTISEVPVTYRPRGLKEGKKLRWLRDGVRAAWALMSWVNYRSRAPRHRGILIALAGGLALGAGTWAVGHPEGRSRTGVLVNGMVVDLSGAPIAGATVKAWRLGPTQTVPAAREAEETASTDAKGGFRLPLDSAVGSAVGSTVGSTEYVLEARCADFAAASVRYVSAGSKNPRVSFVLTPAASISGRVVERATGRGVAGAMVNLSGELGLGSLPGDAHPLVTTAPDGSFSALGLHPGIIRLTAFRDSLRTSGPLTVPLSAGKSFGGATLEVDSTRSASGFVRDRRDASHGVAGVWLDARDVFTGEVIPASAATGPDGSFAIPGLWSSRYDLEVRRDGALPRPSGTSVTIADADVRDLALLIDGGVTVRGRVEPAGEAWVRIDPLGVDGVPVADGALEARLTTTANGAFSFANVEPGDVALVAGTVDGRRGSVVARIGGTGLEGLLLPLVPMSAVSGYVVDEMNRPLPNAWVTVRTENLGPQRLAAMSVTSAEQLLAAAEARPYVFVRLLTGSDGEFKASGLPSGFYEIGVDTERERPVPQEVRAQQMKGLPESDDGVHLALGQAETQSNIRVVAQGCNEDVRGTVLNARGMPAAGVMVSLGSDRFDVPWSLTDPNGGFSFSHVCASYSGLTAADPYSTERAVLGRFQPGEPLTIQLMEAPTLEGTVQSADGQVVPYTLAVVGPEVQYLRITGDDGRFRVPWLRPGSYQLLAEADDGYAVTREVLPQVGGRPVSLSLSAWSALHGQLVDRHRRGLAEIDVNLEAAHGRQVWSTKTDGDGRFSFERVPIKGPALLSVGGRGTRIRILGRPPAPSQAPPSSADDPLPDNEVVVKLQAGQDLQLSPTEVAGE